VITSTCWEARGALLTKNSTDMIILPTRRRLERRRDALYEHLQSILPAASVHQVEEVMRKIHGINLRIKVYFHKNQYEPKEFFEDEDPFETQDPIAL
jgi:hypothetical protein